jgi:hypothetical protein
MAHDDPLLERCPVCDARVERAQIDVTSASDAYPRYIPGMWQCPRGCNPDTGERGTEKLWWE